jgi:hypothetical protein
MANRFVISFVLYLFLLSCTNSKQAEAEQLIATWTNKTVNFPAGVPCSYLGRDTVKVMAMAQNRVNSGGKMRSEMQKMIKYQ